MHHAPLAGFDLAAALLVGLLGSTHCLGMCGPLVGLYAGQLSAQSALSAHRQHLLFNLGRILAYTNLGVLCGMAGLALRVRPGAAGLVGIVVGLFVSGMGTRLLGVGGASARLDRLFARPAVVFSQLWQRYSALARSPSIVLLGAMHSLLPCPLLSVMLTSAVAMGDPIGGGLLLFAFSLGTVPMMWGIGALGRRVSFRHRVTWHRLLGFAVTAWGLVLVVRGLQDLGAF